MEVKFGFVTIHMVMVKVVNHGKNAPVTYGDRNATIVGGIPLI